MATIGMMTLEELRRLIDERVERRLEALLGVLDVEDTGEPDHRTLAEVNESLDRNLWTPPHGTPSVNELIREDRNR